MGENVLLSWRDKSGLNWRVVSTTIGPVAECQTEQQEYRQITNAQPAGAVARRLAEKIAELAVSDAAAAAERDTYYRRCASLMIEAGSLQEQRDRLRGQRDELLEALRYILLLCGEDYDHQPAHVIHHRVKVDILDTAEKAIEKAEST